MCIRRVAPAAAGLFAGRATALGAGRSAALGVGRSAALGAGCGSGARHGFDISGSAASRSLSTGGRPPSFAAYWDMSYQWIKDNGTKYKKFTKEFKEADEVIQDTIRLGKYLFSVTGVAIAGVYYVIDRSVDSKVVVACKVMDDKISSQAMSQQEFKKIAVRDFNDHVSKTQSVLSSVQANVNKLHQKLLDVQGEEREYRHSIREAATVLKLNGYLVISHEEFALLVKKINEIDQRTMESANQVSLNDKEDCSAKVESTPLVEINEIDQRTMESANQEGFTGAGQPDGPETQDGKKSLAEEVFTGAGQPDGPKTQHGKKPLVEAFVPQEGGTGADQPDGPGKKS